MIRRSPAENYFKYLVVHPCTYDDEYIKSVAQDLGLDWLGDWYITWLRDRITVPTPFYPEDPTHTKSSKFLQREGITTAFHPTKDWEAVLRLMDRPRQREVVETLLLAHAPPEVIGYTLKERHRVSFSEKSVQLFRHYFWNVDILGSNDFRVFLDMRHHGVLCAYTDTQMLAQLPSFKRMRHSDPRVVAAKLPHTPLAAVIAQMELGVLPKQIDLGQALDSAMHITSLRAAEASMGGGPVNSQMIATYATTIESLGRARATVVNPEEKLRKDLKKAALATSQQKVPMLPQLTGGKHTTNVYPEPKIVSKVVDAQFDEAEEDDTEDLDATDEGFEDSEVDDGSDNEP